MTIRVAVDASCLPWGAGGIATYLTSVLEELVHDVRLELLLITNHDREVPALPGLQQIPRRIRGAARWQVQGLVREAHRANADVLWSPWIRAPLWPLRMPLVVSAHDLSPVMHRGTKPPLQVAAFATAGRLAVHRARQVLCISDVTARDVHQRWNVPLERIVVTPLAAGPGYTPGDRVAARTRVSARWNLNGSFLLAVGTIEQRKGYDLLVELAPLLPDLPIVVVGRMGPRGQEIAARLEGSCTVLGSVDQQDLADLYRSADLLLTPSIYEGFGLTPMESMACGTPVLVARDSGALDDHYGAAAVVVQRSARAWADAVHATLDDRERHVERSLAFASRHTWSQVAALTADALLSAAANGR